MTLAVGMEHFAVKLLAGDGEDDTSVPYDCLEGLSTHTLESRASSTELFVRWCVATQSVLSFNEPSTHRYVKSIADGDLPASWGMTYLATPGFLQAALGADSGLGSCARRRAAGATALPFIEY